MNIYVSKNIINSARNEVINEHDDISRARSKFDSDFYKVERSVEKRIADFKNAKDELEKEIKLAKKVISENQDYLRNLEAEINNLQQQMYKVDFQLEKEKSRHIPEPKGCDDQELAKKLRDEYNAAIRAQADEIKRLQNLWFTIRDTRDQKIRYSQQIQQAETTLKNIIIENEGQIQSLEYDIRELGTRLNDLRTAINRFKYAVDEALGILKVSLEIIRSASNYINQSIEKFKEANIYIADNEVISIKNISLVINTLSSLKNKINNAYQVGSNLNQKFIYANNRLKDNIMTESGKYIAEMHKSCDEVMDSLKRMEEIVADAMNKLQSYANL